MEKALKLIEDSVFKEADIMFLSDGDCYVPDDFLRKYKRIKEEKEFKTIGVLIDMGRGSVSSSSLSPFCDKITTISRVSDIADSEDNKSIFASL